MSRWQSDPSVPRGDDYDARWKQMAAQGRSIHGEADFVCRRLGPPPKRVLDAGCGTGRVAIELAARGYDVTGADLDPAMLATARMKAPAIAWHLADLADPASFAEGSVFDAIVLAGNVLIFVAPGSEATVVANCASALVTEGLLIAGFQTRPSGYTPEAFDADATSAGFVLVDRHSTWDDDPWTGGTYQVSVHRRG